MELFRDDGCLTDEGLRALVGSRLDELGRLEAAEHLSYCDHCMDRYTALLTEDVLETPPRSMKGTIMTTIWVRMMQNTYGRIAVAGVAAVLALTMWRSGMIRNILDLGAELQTTMPSSYSRVLSEKEMRPKDELQGKPMETRRDRYKKWTDALENLLPGRMPDAETTPTTPNT